jgi:hypothetical protein
MSHAVCLCKRKGKDSVRFLHRPLVFPFSVRCDKGGHVGVCHGFLVDILV